MLARRTNRRVVLLCLLWAGCAPPFDMIQEPRLPTCRGVVDLDGRPQNMDVKWFAPAAGSDRRVHAEWCGTVGPVVINPAPSAPSHVGQPFRAADGRAEALPHTLHLEPADEIAIVSWNVHVGGGDVIALVNRLRSGEWSDGRPVPHFLLLLQEVFRRGPAVPAPLGSNPPVPSTIAASPPEGTRVDVLGAAQQLRLSVFYAPSMRNGRSSAGGDEDRGNAILATFPLSDLQVIELPFERQRRVPVAATVHITRPAGPAVPLRVCSAHLDNRVTHRRMYVFAPSGRTRQTKGLLDALPDEEPVVLGGDFNTWLGGAEGTLRELRRAFPDTPSGPGATFGAARLDYLFFRLPPGWRSEWRVLDDSFGSDHRPVLGWLRLADGESRPER
jgi:endonuclease/exonuclease/phosphatase family metal-dependent hydrolase